MKGRFQATVVQEFEHRGEPMAQYWLSPTYLTFPLYEKFPSYTPTVVTPVAVAHASLDLCKKVMEIEM